jgi:hypothetical protein
MSGVTESLCYGAAVMVEPLQEEMYQIPAELGG